MILLVVVYTIYHTLKSTNLTFKIFTQSTSLSLFPSRFKGEEVKKEEMEVGIGKEKDIHLSWDTIEVKFYHILSTGIVLWFSILILWINYALERKNKY